MARPADLPDYAAPPVTEVVLGMQFAPIAGFSAVHLGLFWERIKEQYPSFQELPPLDPSFEVFGPLSTQLPLFQFPAMQIQMVPLAPRVWFLGPTETDIIQLQADRLVCNWRKLCDGDVYPRYEAVHAKFANAAATFATFLRDHELVVPEINQCEITYINQIAFPEGVDWRSMPSKVFQHWSDLAFDGSDEVEDAGFIVRHIFRDSSGQPFARLVVQTGPMRGRDGTPMLTMNLSVKGRPLGGDLEAALGFFDFGRERIVRRFTAMTTKQMHEQWGRSA